MILKARIWKSTVIFVKIILDASKLKKNKNNCGWILDNWEHSLIKLDKIFNKTLLQVWSEVLIKKKTKFKDQKVFEIEQNLRKMLINEISDEINWIFKNSLQILENYFSENIGKITSKMDNYMSKIKIKQQAKFHSSQVHNLSTHMYARNDQIPKQIKRPNSRNIKFLLDTNTISNHKSFSACCSSINSIHGSYKYQHPDSQYIKVPISWTQSKNQI